MNSAWYSAGDAKFSFFDFRWSKLLFTVFFHHRSISMWGCTVCWFCTFFLQDIIRSQLDAISFYMTMKKIVLEMFALDSLHRLITIRADGFFLQIIFSFRSFCCFFFMSKFPSTLKFKSLCLISFKCFAFQVLLFLFTCWCYRFIMPTSYFAVIHQNTSSSSKNHLMKR